MSILYSLAARHDSLRAINVIRHPVLRRILGGGYPIKDQEVVLYSAVASGRRRLGGQYRARGGAGAAGLLALCIAIQHDLTSFLGVLRFFAFTTMASARLFGESR